MALTTREYLASAVLSRESVDRFLDPEAHNFATFDAELGYLRKPSVLHDGVDGTYTLCTHGPFGERRRLNFADLPCRINTYGDSFTQCDQVSDGESWQEYLAAHIGESIRNFGVGGHGTYQAYRRMVRDEQTEASAEYVILNVWSDDHFRSVQSWRQLHFPGYGRMLHDTVTTETGYMFHANPWAHLRLDLDTGGFEELENPCPTPESLYRLCDPDTVIEMFRDRLDVQARLAQVGASDVRVDVLRRLGEALNVATDFTSPDATARTGERLLTAYAVRSTIHVVDHAREFADARGKKLMVLLSFSESDVVGACRGQPRFDQAFVDHLAAQEFIWVDMLGKHLEDFQDFACDAEAYVARHYIGHYSPAGNHFFAFAIKNALVDWLDPKPPAYRPDAVPWID